MSNRTLVLAAAGVAFLYYLTRTALDLNRLIFQIAGIRNFTTGGGQVSVQLDILIQNPTDSVFPLYDTTIDANILINEMLVGKTVTRLNSLLAPGQQIVVPIVATMSAGNAASAIIALITAVRTGTTLVNLLGSVNIKGVALPLNITYKY